MRLLRQLLPVALLSLTACPQPDECSATVACAVGQTCQEGACVAAGEGFCREAPVSGKPANVLDNSGFECGDPPERWSEPLLGVLTTGAGRTGKAAAVSAKTTTQGYVYLMTSSPVVKSPGVQRLCASAFVKGTAGANAVIVLRRAGGVGSNIDDAFHQPLTTEWTRIQVSAKTTNTDAEVYLGVGVRAPTQGTTFQVDDAQFWLSTRTDGACDER